MKVKQFSTGIFIQGQEIIAIELHPNPDCFVRILNYGAIVQKFVVLNKFSKAQDIVLGFDKVEDYLNEEYLYDYPYLGAVIGRYANRIKDAEFCIDDTKFQLNKNSHTDFIHGGKEGFDKKVWEIVQIQENPEPSVTLGYFSPDGEEGFPGNLSIEIKFTCSADMNLTLEYSAKTDQTTPINLTHHSYFNLNPKGGSVANHLHFMPASNYLEQDDYYCTTGNLISVDRPEGMETDSLVADSLEAVCLKTEVGPEGLPHSHDFRQPKMIGAQWNPLNGYDQSFVLDKPYGEFGLASQTSSDLSGLQLSVYTTEPVAHFYTSKSLHVKAAKLGINYSPFEGFCIETQHHPNAINHANFPSTLLMPGEKYSQVTSYKIDIVDAYKA